MKTLLHTLLPAAAAACFALASPAALAGPYSSLVVFGDSLSDDGNNFLAGYYDPMQTITGNTYVPTNTYASHVYSNGPVWATDFASMIGVALAPSLAGGTDFAFGGATTGGPGSAPPSLRLQTSLYLGGTGNVASASSLYVVAGGGNDARAALTLIAGGADVSATIAAAATSFATNVGIIVDQLKTAGAQHIVVWDTPNLGLAPAVLAGGSSFASLGSFLAASMNGALATRLIGETGVATFDIFGLGNSIAANPGMFGFTDTTDACGAVIGANCNQYAYWDGIHPTAAAHQIIANGVFAVAVPEPETWALLLAGVAAIGWKGKRRRAA